MDASFTTPLITFIQSFPFEILSLATFLICICSILFFLHVFGIAGLYLYNGMIVVAANIQVLKMVPFAFFAEPVALGTIGFATTFLVSDILTEHYGQKVARKGVWLSFAAQVFMTIMMILPLGYQSIPGDRVHESMLMLFTPSPRLLIASLLAYAISQIIDIALFDHIRKITGKKWLWLRTNVASMVSALVDNIIFSVLAWVILDSHPVTFSKLVFTYILGTYGARVCVAIFSTPVMYLSHRCLPQSGRQRRRDYDGVRVCSPLLVATL